MNRPTSKGMWNLAKGSRSQQAVQLPKTYSDHWPLGPPAHPAHLTLWSQGPTPKPVCLLTELQQDQPFLSDPGSAGDDAPVLSFPLVLEQPSAARINLLPREGPRESQSSFRTAWGKRAINLLGPVLVGACQQHPAEGPLWLSKHLRKKGEVCLQEAFDLLRHCFRREKVGAGGDWKG